MLYKIRDQDQTRLAILGKQTIFLEIGAQVFSPTIPIISDDHTDNIIWEIMENDEENQDPNVNNNVEEIVAAGVQGLECCKHCGKANICNPDDKIFYCINEECLKHTCRLCNEDIHIPLTCEEVEKDVETKNRIKIEEKLTEAMMRTCYHCKTAFMKTEGCNKMTCSKCGKSMCYVCRQPVQHYEHFYNTGNGGRQEPGKCPLYINEKELHAQEVLKAAKEAKKNLDPNVKLKHDPTKDVLGQEKN